MRLCYHHSDQPRALEILTKYLDLGINVNARSFYDVTALHLVCLTNTKPNSIDVVRLLLEVIILQYNIIGKMHSISTLNN